MQVQHGGPQRWEVLTRLCTLGEELLQKVSPCGEETRVHWPGMLGEDGWQLYHDALQRRLLREEEEVKGKGRSSCDIL